MRKVIIGLIVITMLTLTFTISFTHITAKNSNKNIFTPLKNLTYNALSSGELTYVKKSCGLSYGNSVSQLVMVRSAYQLDKNQKNLENIEQLYAKFQRESRNTDPICALAMSPVDQWVSNYILTIIPNI